MKKAISILLFAISVILVAPGCAEHRYYARHHDHSARWHHHHDRRPSVDVNIRN